MRERKFEKLHFQNFTIRLSNQSSVIENDTPMSSICKHLYTISVEVCFTMCGKLLEGV